MSQLESNENKLSKLDLEKISPTAKLVAYFRQYSDIPFAKDIAELVGAETLTEELCDNRAALKIFKKFGAPAMEARYKCMISAIRRLGIKQVLEFASGLSFRGLNMTCDPSVTYVETDLPVMMEERLAVMARIPAMQEQSSHKNLFFHTVNALSFDEISQALVHFDPAEPLAIVHEGLYQYLSMNEKKIVAKNIKRILEQFGGAWITPDFLTSAEVEMWQERKAMSKFLSAVGALTGRDFRDRQFQNQEHLAKFFHELGFKVDTVSQIDDSYELSSLKKLGLETEQIKAMSAGLNLWILTLDS